MLSTDHFIALIIGAAVGVGLTLFVQKFTFRAISKELGCMEHDKERKDPANWWKYGGDPYNDYDEQDGNVI